MGTYFKRSNITTGDDRSHNLPGSKFPTEQSKLTEVSAKTSLGRHLILLRYGDHTLGIQIKGLETTALVFASLHLFCFFDIDKSCDIIDVLSKMTFLG